MSALSESVQENRFPTKDLQDYVHDQLAALKVEILKHDKANAELQEARLANQDLVRQLQSEKTSCEHLNERIKELEQKESDLKTCTSQLELELSKARDQSSDCSKLQLEAKITDLSSQLRRAEEDLKTAKSKLREGEQLQQAEDFELLQWRVSRLPIVMTVC